MRRAAALRVAWPLCLALAASTSAAAQERAQGPPAGGRSLDDSAGALAAARAAQARFERVRRASLPWNMGSAGGPCREVVGRFCWRSEGPTAEPPAEPPDIGTERLGLLVELAGLSARAPSDRWLAGQRVRYRVEGAQAALLASRLARDREPVDANAVRAADSAAAEHLAAAETVARACLGDGRADGWCQALLGLALHVAGRTEEAERAFAEGAIAAPWLRGGGRSLRDVLDADAGRLLRQAADSAAFESLLWRLADPFWSLPGNDRRAEHLARVTMGRIQEDARNAFGIPWGDDLRELHVRFGWEVAWERTRRPGAVASAPTVVGHQQDDGFSFLPTGSALEEGPGAAPDAWAPDPSPDREGYAPPYLDSLVPARHQSATFRRGDSLLVLAAVAAPGARPDGAAPDVGAPPASGRRGPSAGIAFLPWPATPPADLAWRPRAPGAPPPAAARAPSAPGGPYAAPSVFPAAGPPPADGVWRLAAVLPAGSYVLSVEALGAGRTGARARYGLRRDTLAAGVLDVSDLLLFAPVGSAAHDTLPGDATPEDLAAVMLASSRVAAGSRFGVAWEVYGVDGAGEPITFDISLRRRSGSFLRRAARWLGLAGAEEAVRVRWTDAARPNAGVYGRRLVVAVPPDADAGDYVLRLVARAPGRADVEVERAVRVAD